MVVLILVDLDGTLLPLEAWDPIFQEISGLIGSRLVLIGELFIGRLRTSIGNCFVDLT